MGDRIRDAISELEEHRSDVQAELIKVKLELAEREEAPKERAKKVAQYDKTIATQQRLMGYIHSKIEDREIELRGIVTQAEEDEERVSTDIESSRKEFETIEAEVRAIEIKKEQLQTPCITFSASQNKLMNRKKELEVEYDSTVEKIANIEEQQKAMEKNIAAILSGTKISQDPEKVGHAGTDVFKAATSPDDTDSTGHYTLPDEQHMDLDQRDTSATLAPDSSSPADQRNRDTNDNERMLSLHPSPTTSTRPSAISKHDFKTKILPRCPHATLKRGVIFLKSCGRVLEDGTVCGLTAKEDEGDPPFIRADRFVIHHMDRQGKGLSPAVPTPTVETALSYEDAMLIVNGGMPNHVMIKNKHGEVSYNDWKAGVPYPKGNRTHKRKASGVPTAEGQIDESRDELGEGHSRPSPYFGFGYLDTGRYRSSFAANQTSVTQTPSSARKTSGSLVPASDKRPCHSNYRGSSDSFGDDDDLFDEDMSLVEGNDNDSSGDYRAKSRKS